MTQWLATILDPHRRIALDTSVLIYHVEKITKYSLLTDLVFAWLERPGHSAVTSTITMTELLVQPYRTLDVRRIDAMYALLIRVPGLEWVAPDLPIADLAARIRAQYGLQTPDALQAATAMEAGATLLLTNDRAFRRVGNLATLLLDDLLGRATPSQQTNH